MIEKAFIHFNEAYYANEVELPEDSTDEINLIISETIGEKTKIIADISFRWFHNQAEPHAKFHAYDDAWEALPHLASLFKVLAEDWNGEFVPVSEFILILRRLKFKDVTEKIQPVLQGD